MVDTEATCTREISPLGSPLPHVQTTELLGCHLTAAQSWTLTDGTFNVGTDGQDLTAIFCAVNTLGKMISSKRITMHCVTKICRWAAEALGYLLASVDANWCLLAPGNPKRSIGQFNGWDVEKNGHEAVVKLLVERDDVDADSRDNSGPTPLSGATENGHEAVVELLLARNDVEADPKDENGRTPLSWAAENGMRRW
ncbi:MAG: hypothetical protein M1816_002174 [Peltula sp. TS41687]|nr:MAG: hypothetical protein M1816_002174 [Peltula sp. TS41687]